MDYKLEYLSRLFKKISSKGIETYVISKIWHLLNDYEIKMVHQQYVTRGQGKYALADIYFPQIKLLVEINEPEHYKNNEKIKADTLRNKEIIKTKCIARIVDCRENLEGIHKQINEIVKEIKILVNRKREQKTFKPWNSEVDFSPEFWKQKNIISVEDEIELKTVEDICSLFNADFKKVKRGFLRRGGIEHPKDNSVLVWWPYAKPRSGWKNVISKNNNTITETNDNENKRIKHFNEFINLEQRRYTFFHHTDDLGFQFYRFKGVYQLDKKLSKRKKILIWKKVANEIKL